MLNGMSSFRQEQIYNSLVNLEKYGVPMLANENTPSVIGDDPGIYYFIPKLAQIFNISIPASVQLFFIGLLVLGSIAVDEH
jgi:hypothetical protein